jgi:trimethylamine--corrinoid protein Co-methyltransferase
MVIDRIFACAALRQPQIICGYTGRGTTAPMTMAGMLALSLAESLFSITLSQLKTPGTPVFMAGNVGNANMASAIPAIMPPEKCLGSMAQAQLAASYGLPSWGLAGATESKLIDAQAGAEAALGLLSQTLGGATLIHDVGYLDRGMICSADMLVLGDELIGWVKRLMRGVPVNEYELAVEVINSVGPGGNFTRLKHTAENCRRDYWKPTGVFYRETFGTWEKEGSLDTKQRLRKKTLKILSEHKPKPIEDRKMAEMMSIKEKALKELAIMRQY